jgi:hypothetical protein
VTTQVYPACFIPLAASLFHSPRKLCCQRTGALACPAQWRHGVTSSTGIDQSSQCLGELRLFGLAAFTTTTGTALLGRRGRARIIEFSHPVSNGSVRQSGSNRYRFDSTPTERARLRRRPSPSSALIQVCHDRRVLLTNPFDYLCIRHARDIIENPSAVKTDFGNLLLSAPLRHCSCRTVSTDLALVLVGRIRGTHALSCRGMPIGGILTA